jgi:hypothetical protein
VHLQLGQVDDHIGIQEGTKNLGTLEDPGLGDLYLHSGRLIEVDDLIGPTPQGGLFQSRVFEGRCSASDMKAQGGIVPHPNFGSPGVFLHIGHHRLHDPGIDHGVALGRGLEGQVGFDQNPVSRLDNLIEASDGQFDGFGDGLLYFRHIFIIADKLSSHKLGIALQGTRLSHSNLRLCHGIHSFQGPSYHCRLPFTYPNSALHHLPAKD